ncbi:MAG TPA: dTDP-4-dehydrorhamnose reductase [Candidatus Eisenbacteria bacterium]|nr:dTDP-4-dehydrorhamnose reductase [Candidatus Eisenbacteria bacterium]
MRVLATGGGGMLARAAVPAFMGAGHDVLALTKAELDVTDPDAVRRAVRDARPDWVLHLAAFTHVDACETEAWRAFAVNGFGAANVAAAAREAGAGISAISTDYVFPGDAREPYREHDPAAPRSTYGASKWVGEECVRWTNPRHQVVRTSWLFGAGGPNFVDTILAKARAGDALRVVDDQRGSPTWTGHLAEGLLALVARGTPGTYHCTSSGACTWFDLAAYALERAGVRASLERTDTASFPRPARRPAWSVLSAEAFERATGWRMPDWRQGVDRYLAERAGAATPAGAGSRP